MKFNKNWKINIGGVQKTIDEVAPKKYKKILLYFYPKDNTPGCTGQAVDFTALKPDFEKMGIMVIGVSPDSLDEHKKFIKDHNLKITLGNDEDTKLAEKMGVWGEKKNYGKTYIGLIRSSFLIDIESREIEKEWRNVRAKGHAMKLLKELQTEKEG